MTHEEVMKQIKSEWCEIIKERTRHIITASHYNQLDDETYNLHSRNMVGALLADDRILIKDPDQSLPNNVFDPPLDTTQEGWRDIIEATYKLMLKEGWVKVLKEK